MKKNKQKILIIKLGALGDVVRTLPILPAIKEKYPNSEIYWVTKENAIDIFKGNPYTKKIIKLGEKIKEKFNILYSLDIDERAFELVDTIEADVKYGFCLKEGYPSTFNIGAEYYLNTVFDDNLKKTNKKTYQEMIFEVAELPYKKQIPKIYLNENDERYAQDFIKKNKIRTERLVGIHLGAGSRWPSKAWHESCLIDFIKKAKQRGYEILLFGGPNEIRKQNEIFNELKNQGIFIYRNNPTNTINEFSALVNLCKVMICSDSFALHISLALEKPTIGLFFCTSPNEVEGYGVLKKIVSPLLYKFFPEKMDLYDENLVKSISPEEVLLSIEEFIKPK